MRLSEQLDCQVREAGTALVRAAFLVADGPGWADAAPEHRRAVEAAVDEIYGLQDEARHGMEAGDFGIMKPAWDRQRAVVGRLEVLVELLLARVPTPSVPVLAAIYNVLSGAHDISDLGPGGHLVELGELLEAWTTALHELGVEVERELDEDHVIFALGDLDAAVDQLRRARYFAHIRELPPDAVRRVVVDGEPLEWVESYEGEQG